MGNILAAEVKCRSLIQDSHLAFKKPDKMVNKVTKTNLNTIELA